MKIKIHRTSNLPVLYGCAMSVTLTEERRLGVFQDSLLWKILGPKRKALIGDREKLRSQEIHGLYSLQYTYIQGPTNLWHHDFVIWRLKCL
jgi:hypothetical protein